jgi:hypothetical protein
MTHTCVAADAIDFLRQLPEASVDLVFGSPPYMDARTYGINAQRGCEEWVNWMLDVSEAAVRTSKGLVLWVVAGVQRENCYWPGCEGLAWEWWKRGNHLWRPCVWWKVDADEGGTGIPGSGGKQWLRADWEYVLCFKRPGWLPWADNTAMGHEPYYDQVGGEMSNRTAEGQRINERVFGKRGSADNPWGTDGRNGLGGRTKDGKKNSRANHTARMKAPAGHDKDGVPGRADGRPMPKIANPGNVIQCPTDDLIVKARVGGGHMGNDLCHEGEAPFPEKLAEFFILSFCPPGGTVVDCFSGSGTTAAMCKKHGRNFTGCDLRQSQVDLTLQRLEQESQLLFT